MIRFGGNHFCIARHLPDMNTRNEWLRFICLALVCAVVTCCSKLHVRSSNSFQSRVFRALPVSRTRAAGLTSGRPAYVTVDDDSDKRSLFLYHIISGSKGDDKKDGLGRWVINDVLGPSDTALAYVNTWAVNPTLHSSLADNDPNMHWKIHNGERWVPDEEMSVSCGDSGDDSTIYFSVEGPPWQLAGFFVEHQHLEDGSPLYAHVGAEDEEQMYLYKHDDKWIIGPEIGSSSGLAYTTAPGVTAAAELGGAEWFFVTGPEATWQSFDVHIISADSDSERNLDIYAQLRQHRSLRAMSDTYSLRNGLPLPAVGLGTGGVAWQRTSEVLTEALQLGYRLLDSAREYGNERVIGDLLHSHAAGVPRRADVFVLSKVWPTFLGFVPTSREITKSLEALQSSYVDMYLLHWPSCNKDVSWMHCETTVDPAGHWRQSWHALERAYAEGRVASIGVSNFDQSLLHSFHDFGTVRPHLVQNFAQPGRGQQDLAVREWCRSHGAVFMPYAHQRNLQHLSAELREVMRVAAARHGVSMHVVASRFFYQTGAAIVPRSSQSSHLRENLLDVAKFELSAEEMALMGWTPLPADHAEL